MTREEIPAELAESTKAWLSREANDPEVRFSMNDFQTSLQFHRPSDYKVVSVPADKVPAFGAIVATAVADVVTPAVKTPLNGLAYRYADRKAFVRKFPKSGHYTIQFVSNDEVEAFVADALKYGYVERTGVRTPSTNEGIRRENGKIFLFLVNNEIDGWNPITGNDKGYQIIQYAAKEHRTSFYTGK